MGYIELNGRPLCEAPICKREVFEAFFADCGRKVFFPACSGNLKLQPGDVANLRTAFPNSRIRIVEGGCPSNGRITW